MSNAIYRSDFLKSVLQNGVGRYVPQLQRITFLFCKTHGSSSGIRSFIEKELVDYSRNYPGTVVYLKPRRFREPIIRAEYLNGNQDSMAVGKMSSEEILRWVEYMAVKSGQPITRLRKYWHTDCPSIQGVWTPFTHQPTSHNVQKFPDESLSEYKPLIPCATQYLLQNSISSDHSHKENESL